MTESRTKRVTLHLPLDTVSSIEKLAAREHQDVSKIIRTAIDRFLNLQANKDDIDLIAAIVRQEVKLETRKQADRLAAMLFKIGVINAGNYFLNTRMLSDMISPSLQEDYKDISANARKLGIDYMKQTVSGVIEFLENRDEVEEITERIKTDYINN